MEWQDKKWRPKLVLEERRLAIQAKVEQEDLVRWAMQEVPEVELETMRKVLPTYNLRWHPSLFKRLVGFAQI